MDRPTEYPVPRALDELRAKAWIGDAVLALCARQWILQQCGVMSSALFENMTSNVFLTTLGNPTKIEAQIGLQFEHGGLEGARAYVEAVIIPQFTKQERNRRRARKHRHRNSN